MDPYAVPDSVFFVGIAVAFIVGVIAGRISKSTDNYDPPEGAPARLNPVRDVTSPGCKVVAMPTVKPSSAWPGRSPVQRVQTQLPKSVVESGDVA